MLSNNDLLRLNEEYKKIGEELAKLNFFRSSEDYVMKIQLPRELITSIEIGSLSHFGTYQYIDRMLRGQPTHFLGMELITNDSCPDDVIYTISRNAEGK